MKKLLFLLTTGLVFTTSCLNTKYVFSTINFILKVKSNVKTNLKTRENKLNSLLYSNHNNEFEDSWVPNSNSFELKNYNSVFLKSLAYDQTNLKLTSTLPNLINYDLKHHLAKTDLYLDKVDYLKMQSLASKDKKETLIGNNLVFLNHFFNDQGLTFNPNGHVISRRSLLSNTVSNQHQSIIVAKNNLKKLNNNYFRQQRNSTNQKNSVPKISIDWGGIYFTTDHKILTHRVLNILNGSASFINAITKFGKSAPLHDRLSTNNLNAPYGWDSWTNEQIYEYLVADETAAQSDSNFSFQALLDGLPNRWAVAELKTFKNRLWRYVDELIKENPSLSKEYSKMSDAVRNATTRYAKERLGFRNQESAAEAERFDPENQEAESSDNPDLSESADDIVAVNEESSSDAASVVAQAEDIAVAEEQVIETAAAAEGIPLIRWVVAAIVAIAAAAIPLIITLTLKKLYHWKLKNPKFPTKGPWTLKQIWFNKKTRLFNKLTSDEIQYNGHFFKPWFGKIKSKIFAVKPVHVLSKYITHDARVSINLHKTYNLITGTNNKFNLIVNPATLKQLVASSYLPNPQYSVKKVLAMNHLNLSNLNLSNNTWIKLIKKIKHPYVNRNYAPILSYDNQKLIYSNIKKNDTTNFAYHHTNYLQQMIIGNHNRQDLLANSTQITSILNDLENIKNDWNDTNSKNPNLTLKGIKNSNYYNPDHYASYVAWYYYHFLKPNMWIDSDIDDATNIKFLSRIFTKLRMKSSSFTLKQSLGLINTNSIIDLSSEQF